MMLKVFQFVAVFFFSAHSAIALAGEPKEIFWDELIPEGYTPQQEEPVINHDAPSKNASTGQMSPNAPVVEALNGKTIKIPGFVVPLEGNDTHVTEFLLVPFFGACIHVPPPPSNQIIHVKFPKGAAIDTLYDAVVLTGVISTQSWSGDIAQVGYSMTGTNIAPYDE